MTSTTPDTAVISQLEPPAAHLDNTSPTARPAETSRDWSLGFVTGYRVRVLVCMALTVAALYALQNWLWPRGMVPTTLLEHLWAAGAVLWLGAVIPGLLGLIGMIMFRQPRGLDNVQPIEQLVVFRIVSRGTNVEALGSTIRRCLAEMAATPLFEYLVEVVIDHSDASELPRHHRVRYLLVPRGYSTANGTLFKARGLQYAVEHSTIPSNAWLVHLDEETQPTASGIRGIARMISEEETTGRLRIGQGAILYHRDWAKHPFLTSPTT